MPVRSLRRTGRERVWIEKRCAELRRSNTGSAFVLESPVVRGTFKAVLHMTPMPMPYSIEPNMDSARRWCLARLPTFG
jgi:hypothetical protein